MILRTRVLGLKPPPFPRRGRLLRRCGMQKRVECECGWSLQTDDEAKLVAGVQQHAKQIHNMEGVTKDQVLAQARPA